MKKDKANTSTLIINIACLIICTLLIAYNKTAMIAAKKAFDLWLTAVMPALFPFFVCTSIMQKNGLFQSNKSNPFVSIFAVYLVAAISGAPSGARLMAQTNERFGFEGRISSNLCALCNVVSPMFIIGSVSTKMVGSIKYAFPIMIGHYLSTIIVLTIYLFIHRRKIKCLKGTTKPSIKNKNSKVIVDSIVDGISAMLKICGTIIFFMVFTEVINKAGLFDLILKPFVILGMKTDFLESFAIGAIEMINGCNSFAQLDNIPHALRCAFICFTITFSGICIMIQSMAFANFSSKKYLGMKLLCAILSFVIAYFAALVLLPDSIEVFGIMHNGLENSGVYINNLLAIFSIAFASILGAATIYLICIIKPKRGRSIAHEKV